MTEKISYAASAKNFAKKILKDFGDEVVETQNKADNSAILSELKKRLNDLSKKTRAGKIISKAIKRYNRKDLAGYKAFTETKSAEEIENTCEKVYDEAYSIFKEAADAGIELPSVPAVDGTFWGFKLLHNWCNESLRKISKPQKHISKPASDSKAGETKKRNNLTGEALALAMLVQHPDWSDTKIAKAVGVSRTTLYDWPKFKKAKEALKQGKNDIPRGSKNGETGDIEAWDDKT
ncbi:MAG: hypothetical protein ABR969_09995 [Sedimentisphaerales bacterium]|jgi:transcriptional regulator with PAS, ATPase and Fis domain